MRIAHVTATFPPYYGGTGNVCYHNARVLASRGHDVHVFTRSWPGDPDDPPGVTVHRVKPVLRVGNAPVIPQLTQIRNFDVLHLHYPFVCGAELTTVGTAFHRIPSILTYHNDMRAPGLRGAFFSIYERTLAPAVLRRAKRVCGVSIEHVVSSPMVRRVLSPKSHKLVEMPNGVDASTFNPTADGVSVRKRFAIPNDAFVIGFVASLDTAHHFKRLDLLIEAVAQMTAERVHLLIVGDGDRRPIYENQAKQLGIGNRAHFTGNVTHSQLPPYLVASDCLVLPSDSVESFGLVLIEAMACELPVIATNLPGVRTLVNDGCDGYLVPVRNVEALVTTLERLRSMPRDARVAMGKRGREKVIRKYDWERIGGGSNPCILA